MNIHNLHADFLAQIQRTNASQTDIAKRYGVQQAIISRFINGKNGISLSTTIALWPFIYGVPFPEKPPATPQPQQAHDKAEA